MCLVCLFVAQILFLKRFLFFCHISQNDQHESRGGTKMSELFSEVVQIKDSDSQVTIKLDANANTATFGSFQNAGTLIVLSAANKEALRFDSIGATLRVGGASGAGNFYIRDVHDFEVFQFDGANSTLRIGNQGNPGHLLVRNKVGDETLHLNGETGLLKVGTFGTRGHISIRDEDDREIFQFDGNNGDLRIGNVGKAADLLVRDGENREAIQIRGGNALVTIGTAANAGDLVVTDEQNRQAFYVDGGAGTVRVGTNGNGGLITVRNGMDQEVLRLDGDTSIMRVGAPIGSAGHIYLRSKNGADVIHLDGENGDIILSNADAAEHFDLAEPANVLPAMLMVLNPEGKLEPASKPYDRKVVGVVAGGGNFRPGIVLDHQKSTASRAPISVLGKVSCMADATYGTIEVGDLLTTSSTVGHAMKASDPQQSFGSVIGKALSPLAEGRGLVNLLITLQ
jgi:outer membrane protein assembly factor BamB